MISSARRPFLTTSALVVGLAAALALALSIRLLFGGALSPRIELVVFALCGVAVLAWLLAILLLVERTRAGRDARQSDAGQLAAAIRHCPIPLTIACLAGAVLATLQGLAIGDAEWVSGQVLTRRELRGFLAAATFFLCLAFPVIASARQESVRDED
jgi:hypothetical protein